MSGTIKISSRLDILHDGKRLFSPRLMGIKLICLVSNKPRIRLINGGNIKGKSFLACYSGQEQGRGIGCVQALDNSPVSVELEPILSESQFDRVIAEAQQVQEPVVIVWMASWCRKCIYLKPKLEKLAAEYYPRIRSFSVDVNNVSHKLVVRAGVTKMPTIQIWKDGEKHGEVIGGHKAHLVVNEIREMIESEDAL